MKMKLAAWALVISAALSLVVHIIYIGKTGQKMAMGPLTAMSTVFMVIVYLFLCSREAKK